MSKITKELLNFIDESPSVFHVINSIENKLCDYEELKENQHWNLKPGGKYFVTRNDSSIIAFELPANQIKAFHMAAAHSDSPCFKIKPNGEILVEDNYLKLNTEGYGGMLMAPWFDRPLAIAGRVIVKDKELKSYLVNLDKDMAMIPSLAIHMDRGVNDGKKLNAQNDMLPLIGGRDMKGKFMSYVAKNAGVEEKSILGADLFLYNHMKGMVWGEDEEFISSRSLDDLQCVYSIIVGMLESKANSDKVKMACIFDNEEVGSLSKQGADSTFLEDTINRICEVMKLGVEDRQIALANSFMVSADNAHAVHPNATDKADPTNRPYINKGIVVKFNGNQKYTSDGISAAYFKEVCERAQVPTQTFVNRSDMAGGSTLGNISNAHISVNSVDIGLPQLAMHSPYETAGVKDTECLIKALKTFYES